MKQNDISNYALPEGMELNLCDFALFLSVMKNKEAHEITLSIIMENPDLHLDEIHVEEVEGLHLDDGTTKIFLNMSSKNGPVELVSLLQYMKDSHLDNPNVLSQDKRLRKLDAIVNEVKEAEEWEAVSMSIYSVGLVRGREIGEDSLRIEQVCKKLRRSKSAEMIAVELEEDEAIIRRICEMAAGFAPEYDSEKVMEAWFKANAD